MVFTICALLVGGMVDGGQATPQDFRKAKDTGWVFVQPGDSAYDRSTVIQFSGKVIGLIESGGPKSSVTLLVKSANGGTTVVELGPKDYFEGQALHISPKDTVVVRGSKVSAGGCTSILCETIVHNGDKIAFRTPKGIPFWTLNK